MNNLSAHEIKNYLPHRYPFLLIDRVVESTDTTLVAIKNVTVNEPFFMGHFPQKPVMPGVLIIEALAQASGMLIFKTVQRLLDKDFWFYLAGIDNARFKKIVEPGDQLRLEVELLKVKRDIWKFKGTATVDGHIACSAEIINARGTLA
ncbi:MAG: 3-hydroxyacyl-ACP dehydratase FabZ [Gammaproteobacteria bacterium]|nr:3-hydroxyacyl-ACP dehydratase FabZ [Gammaproteobacteria bacterium]